MTFLSNNFLPNDLIIPEDPEESRLVLTDYLRRMILAINDKDIAQYSQGELLNGQKWFPTAASSQAIDYRFVYRKVINFGTLPNATTKTVAHGITTNANTTFTRIYATATDPGASTITSAIPIPFVDPAALANGILLSVDATNVSITTAIDYSSYTSCYVVLEYLQN